MTRVLRLTVNDRVELFDGRGGIVEGSLLQVNNNSVEVVANLERQIIPPTGPHWHVAAAFGTLKGGRADWLVEKCTELGARSLTPLLTQRSAAIAGARSDRWHRISTAAIKQCSPSPSWSVMGVTDKAITSTGQRLHALEVREPVGVQALLPDVAKAGVAFLAAAGATPLVKAVLHLPKRVQDGILLVGPEGDFTTEEIELLVGAGAVPVGLGPRRLRVETAAVAILATVMLIADSSETNSSPL